MSCFPSSLLHKDKREHSKEMSLLRKQIPTAVFLTHFEDSKYSFHLSVLVFFKNTLQNVLLQIDTVHNL